VTNSSFGRELVQRMRGEILEKNPLLIIGISQAILDLNISEDEIYDICQHHARYALSKVHPDSHEGKETQGMLELTEALTMLRDRQVFHRALGELREMHAFTSTNERTLRFQLDRSKEENNVLSGRVAEQKRRLTAESRFHTWAQTYTVGGAMRFPHAKGIKALAECKSFQLARVSFEVCDPPSKEQQAVLEKLRSFYKKVENKNRDSRAYLRPEDGAYMRDLIDVHHLNARPLAELIKQALKETNVPSLSWTPAHAAHELGFPKLAANFARRHRGRVARETEGSWTSFGITAYQNALKSLCRVAELQNLYVREAAIIPKILPLVDQMLKEGPNQDPIYFYVLGSVEMEVALSCIQPSRGIWVSLQDEMLPEVEPFVAPGKAIISFIAPKPLMIRTGGMNAWTMAINERRGIVHKLRATHSLCMSHIVLGVE
jgi:hypothetical protein